MRSGSVDSRSVSVTRLSQAAAANRPPAAHAPSNIVRARRRYEFMNQSLAVLEADVEAEDEVGRHRDGLEFFGDVSAGDASRAVGGEAVRFRIDAAVVRPDVEIASAEHERA